MTFSQDYKYQETQTPLLLSLHLCAQGKLDAQSKLRSAQGELASLQDSLDEEQEAKNALQKQLSAAKSDAAMWRSKYEGEATQRIEELEEAK